jgi:acetoin utilization deacetylase AcuC-like enzyme
MSENYNLRNPEVGEVSDMFQRVKKRREQLMKYKILKQLLESEKEVDVTVSPAIFEALNKERMEFEEILKLHPDQAKDAIEATKEDRESITENVYWNRNSPAKWARLGHIPPCIYYSRPTSYWNDKKLLKNFFNMFTKFRVSTNKI